MKEIRHNKLLHYVITIIMTVIVTSIGYYFIHGIPLFGIPKIEQVSYVEISNTRLDTNSRKITAVEDIEKAINITKFLTFRLGSPEQKEPFIELTFHLKDGKVFVIGANEKTVYNNGRAYSIKGDNGALFIKVAEGLFFFDDLIKQDK